MIDYRLIAFINICTEISQFVISLTEIADTQLVKGEE